MAEKLPSQTGRKYLLNIASGRSAAHGLYGAIYGGHPGTIKSLRNRGLIDHQNQLTATGHKMIERLTVVPEVAHVA